MPRPTSAPGLAESTPDRWWRRSPAQGGGSFAEYGVDFGEQREDRRWVVGDHGRDQQLDGFAGARQNRRRHPGAL